MHRMPQTYGSVRLIPHMVKNMEGYIQMNPSTIPTHFCSKIGRVDAPPDSNGRFEFILSDLFHLRTLDQNQVGTKIRVVPKSGWYQNQGGSKIRVVPKSGWYQIRVVPNQGGTKIRYHRISLRVPKQILDATIVNP